MIAGLRQTRVRWQTSFEETLNNQTLPVLLRLGTNPPEIAPKNEPLLHTALTQLIRTTDTLRHDITAIALI
jgi:hypothetical protein